MNDAPRRDLTPTILRAGLLLALTLGAIDAIYYRQWDLNPDGVSYVDMARSFVRHGPGALINGYWSPVYPALIGISMLLVRPDNDVLFPLVRAIGFVVFAITTGIFAYLVRQFLSRFSGDELARARAAAAALAWSAYLLLILKATGLFLVTPDVGVAGFVFAGASALLAITASPRGVRWWIGFGVVAAVGYWWKAILFPVAGVSIAIAGIIAYRRRDGWIGPVAASGAFGLCALALVIPVSALTGRATFGETGRLNQLWYVNAAPNIQDRCTELAGRPTPDFGVIAADSLIAGAPRTCAMTDEWPEATLPLWYDPSRWYRETSARFSARETVAAVGRDIGYLYEALRISGPLLAVIILAFGGVAVVTRAGRSTTLPLVALAAAPTAFYLIVYVELRHVTPFLLVALIAGAQALLARRSPWATRVLVISAVVVTAEAAWLISRPTLSRLSIFRHEILDHPRPTQTSIIVARALRAKGLKPGDRVATLNALWNVDWAVRVGLRVRAYTSEYTEPIAQSLLALETPCTRETYLAALRTQGIRAVVFKETSGVRAPRGFERLGEDTPYWSLPVPPDAPASECATRSSSGTAAR
jgi:hypothetical protein